VGHGEVVMSTKQQRQQIISRLIAQENIANQPQLQELLREQGIEATQATVSRDLEELGAIKIRVAGGDTIYAIAEYAPARIAPSDQLRRVMAEWVAEVSHSGNLVVVRTPPGCAHVVASALDRSGLVGLLGTVAGDDTILCIATEDMSGSGLAEQLRSLSGVSDATGGIPRRKGTANV
jgi:transcriptional regulator of arginine metabolism